MLDIVCAWGGGRYRLRREVSKGWCTISDAQGAGGHLPRDKGGSDMVCAGGEWIFK